MAVGKERICNALMRVASRKEIRKVTVTDVIEEAGINRSSFYYHFHDIRDVLDYMYELFANQYFEAFSAFELPEGKHRDVAYDETVLLAVDVNRFFYDNREMFLFLRNVGDKSVFYDKLAESYAEAFRPFVFYFELSDGSLYRLPEYEMERYLKLNSFMWLAFMDMWAESGFSDSPEEMQSFAEYLSSIMWTRVERKKRFPQPANVGALSMREVKARNEREE